MNNQLTTTNQDAKLALAKSKSLLNLTNKLIQHEKKDIIKNFAISPHVNNLCLGGLGMATDISFEDSVVVVGGIGRINLIDLKNGEVLKAFYGHENGITKVALSSDNKTLVSVSGGEIKIWDTSTSKCIKTLNVNCYGVDCIRFVKNEILVVYYSRDDVCEILSLHSENIIKISKNYVRYLNLSADGKYLAASSLIDDYDDYDDRPSDDYIHKIVLWDTNNKKPIKTIKNKSYKYFTHIMHINSKNKYFITTKSSKLGNHGLLICNMFNNEIKNIDLCGRDIVAIDVSMDDKYLVACEQGIVGTTLHLINLENLEVIGKWKIGEDSHNFQDIRFVNRNSDFIIVGRYNFIKYITVNNIKQKDITYDIDNCSYREGLELKYEVNSNTEMVSCAAISYDLKTIVSCSSNKIKLWNLANGKLLKSVVVSAEYPNRVKISSIHYSLDNNFITINVLKADPYKVRDYLNETYDLKNFMVTKENSIKNQTDVENNTFSLKIIHDMIKVYQDKTEIYTIYNFIDDEYITMKPSGYFYSSTKAVDKYIRISEVPLTQRKLTTEEIKHFKKENLLDLMF